MDIGQLSFTKNNKSQGNIPWNIVKNKTYHLAIAGGEPGCKFEIID